MHLLQLSMAHSMGKSLKGLSGAQLPMVRLHSNTVLPTHWADHPWTQV